MGLKMMLHSPFPEKGTVHTEEVQKRPQSEMAIWNEGTLRGVRKAARPDTEITMWYPDKFPGSVAFLYPTAVNDITIVNNVIKAEEQGYDAAVIACHLDNGLQEARGAVKIPVTGPCESGMIVAQLVGRKFAVVTVRPALIPRMEEHLRLYGWEDRAIKTRPIRYFDPWYWDACIACFNGKPEKLISDFEKIALECINDGADAVIMGCFQAAAALSLAGYREIGNTGVPFISSALAAVKLAEVMADLRQSIGLTKTEALHGPYKTLPREMLIQLRKDFAF